MGSPDWHAGTVAEVLVSTNAAHTTTQVTTLSTQRMLNTLAASRQPLGHWLASAWVTPARTQQAASDIFHRSQIQCYNCQGWGHMRHECPSARNVHQAKSLNSGRKRNSNPPCSQQQSESTSSQPDLVKIAPGPWYHNCNAAVHVIGRANEAEILIDNNPVTALIDTRAQASTMTQDFCLCYGYDILSMTQMLRLEGTGEFRIPYLGYVEACIWIP